MTAQPYTKRDLELGEQIVRELHGLKGFDAWAERIAKAIAAESERPRIALKPLADIKLWSDAYQDCKRDHIMNQELDRYFTVEQIKAARKASEQPPPPTIDDVPSCGSENGMARQWLGYEEKNQ